MLFGHLFDEANAVSFTYLHFASVVVGEAVGLCVVVAGGPRVVGFHLLFHVMEPLLSVPNHRTGRALLFVFLKVHCCMGQPRRLGCIPGPLLHESDTFFVLTVVALHFCLRVLPSLLVVVCITTRG